jgi:hypothetical protein
MGDLSMTDDVCWLNQHASLLFEMDARGRIMRLNEPDPETEAPRIFLARGRASTLILFRDDVPDDIASRLGGIAHELPPWDGEPTDRRDLGRLTTPVVPEHELVEVGLELLAADAVNRPEQPLLHVAHRTIRERHDALGPVADVALVGRLVDVSGSREAVEAGNLIL